MPSARMQTLEQRRMFLRAIFESRAGVSVFDRIDEAAMAFREPVERPAKCAGMAFPEMKLKVEARVAV